MTAELIITIAKDGVTVKTEVDGVKGESCTDITKKLNEAFGQVLASEKKPEYYMQIEDVIHTTI